MSHENMSSAEDNALNAAQVLFTANPVFLAPQMKQALQARERILDEVEKFSAAWFQRRQEAARTMIEAGRRVVSQGETGPTSALKEIVNWQTHSMERLAADAKDCTEMLNRCASAFVVNGIQSSEEIRETAKQATKSSTSEPV